MKFRISDVLLCILLVHVCALSSVGCYYYFFVPKAAKEVNLCPRLDAFPSLGVRLEILEIY